MKIAEVSERYGLSSDTLRYYERIGLILTVQRDTGGIRDYNEIDLRRVEFVKRMRSVLSGQRRFVAPRFGLERATA